MDAQIPAANRQAKEFVTSTEFSSRFSSKIECFRFLSSECKIYLPKPEHVTIWHLRDLAAGAKQYVKADHVKHIAIPQYEGLTINDMLEYVEDKPVCMRYLPVEKEVHKLPRQYLANVIHSVKGENFQRWVDQRVKERNEKIKSE